MQKLKLGIIGAGGIVCRMHLPDLAQGADFEVSVIGGRREHRLKHQCQEFDIPRWTQDYDAIIADGTLDAILVGTPAPAACFVGCQSIGSRQACAHAKTALWRYGRGESICRSN